AGPFRTMTPLPASSSVGASSRSSRSTSSQLSISLRCISSNSDSWCGASRSHPASSPARAKPVVRWDLSVSLNCRQTSSSTGPTSDPSEPGRPNLATRAARPAASATGSIGFCHLLDQSVLQQRSDQRPHVLGDLLPGNRVGVGNRLDEFGLCGRFFQELPDDGPASRQDSDVLCTQ